MKPVTMMSLLACLSVLTASCGKAPTQDKRIASARTREVTQKDTPPVTPLNGNQAVASALASYGAYLAKGDLQVYYQHSSQYRNTCLQIRNQFPQSQWEEKMRAFEIEFGATVTARVGKIESPDMGIGNPAFEAYAFQPKSGTALSVLEVRPDKYEIDSREIAGWTAFVKVSYPNAATAPIYRDRYLSEATLRTFIVQDGSDYFVLTCSEVPDSVKFHPPTPLQESVALDTIRNSFTLPHLEVWPPINNNRTTFLLEASTRSDLETFYPKVNELLTRFGGVTTNLKIWDNKPAFMDWNGNGRFQMSFTAAFPDDWKRYSCPEGFLLATGAVVNIEGIEQKDTECKAKYTYKWKQIKETCDFTEGAIAIHFSPGTDLKSAYRLARFSKDSGEGRQQEMSFRWTLDKGWHQPEYGER